VFTRSAITPPKVNRFGWNLENSGYIVGGWPWRILGAIRAVEERTGKPGEIFLSSRQSRISRISRRPNFTKFEYNMSIGWAMKTFWTEFCKFYRKVSFFQKTQKVLKHFNVLRFQAAITPQWLRKFTTKITLHWISNLHFCYWNQFKVIPWPVHSLKKPPQIFCDVRRRLTTRQITLTSLSRRWPITIDYWVSWH